MKKITTATLFSVLVIVGLLQLVPFAVAQTNEENDQLVTVQVNAFVYEVDVKKSLANVSINFLITNYPHDSDDITVTLVNDETVTKISCSKFEKSNNQTYYSGETQQMQFVLVGSGEPFPFDSYSIPIQIYHISSIGTNFTLENSYHQGYFAGLYAFDLENDWNPETLLTPRVFSTDLEIRFDIERSENEIITSILKFYVPTLACYFLLSSALILNPEKGLGERLRIFLSIFFFVPTFLIGIQSFLPYRTTLSLPELLLINLLVSTATLGVFSVIGKHQVLQVPIKTDYDGTQKIGLLQRRSDLLGVIFCMVFWLVLYRVVVEVMVLELSSILSYFVFPTYVLWIPFVDKQMLSFKRNPVLGLIFGFVLTILTYFGASILETNSMFIFSFWTVIFGAILLGIFVTMYLQSGDRGAVISCISGMIGSLIAGSLLGALSMNYLLGEGGGVLGGFFAGIGLGPLFGAFGIMAGFIVVRFNSLITYLKNKRKEKK